MLKVICAGLPRTGNTSLAEALRILGYKTLQHSPERLPLFPTADTSFRVFDDVDAVVDLPAAMYWKELSAAYPEAKVIITVRETEAWYESMVRHIEVIHATASQKDIKYADQLHTLVFGSAEPSRYWYGRRLEELEAWFSEGTAGFFEGSWSLFDITSEDAQNNVSGWNGEGPWEDLCTFLDKPIPDVPFPWLNKGCHGDTPNGMTADEIRESGRKSVERCRQTNCR